MRGGVCVGCVCEGGGAASSWIPPPGIPHPGEGGGGCCKDWDREKCSKVDSRRGGCEVGLNIGNMISRGC